MSGSFEIKSTNRRCFLRRAVVGATASFLTTTGHAEDEVVKETGNDLVKSIEHTTIFSDRKSRTTWFHPRACMVPTSRGPIALMTLQTIGGSDYFGHVNFTVSADDGKSWSQPEPIPGLGRTELDSGYSVGVCDVVPEYHPNTDTVLAVGHNVYYKGGALARPQRERWPVYTVRNADGQWSKPQRLEWPDPRGTAIYTCGCAERLVLPDGDVLAALSFGPKGRVNRSVATVRCSFDGKRLAVRRVGNELATKAGRGLLEPSLAAFNGQYYMTIRAEDNSGYVSVSTDGLRWQPQTPWRWDTGEPIAMSTTQQHWLTHSDGLYLVYTRKAASNTGLFRWRSPLFMARVDTATLRLVRESERVVLPIKGDAVNEAEHVARMGNFHTVSASPGESWVTVGETLPKDGWAGDTLLARIHWQKPNRLVNS